MTPTSVSIYWDKVPWGTSHGIIIGYVCYYRRMNDGPPADELLALLAEKYVIHLDLENHMDTCVGVNKYICVCQDNHFYSSSQVVLALLVLLRFFFFFSSPRELL